MMRRASDEPAERLRVLQVSTYDIIGGAERVAWNLFQAYRRRGHPSWLAVGTKLGDDPDVLPVPRQEGGAVPRLLLRSAKAFDRFWGLEDFHHPGTRHLLELPGQRPDIVHCHNLHGGHFDLRALPRLSREVPVVLTLHDAWLLSGHCAHSFDCERWKTGCGRCPDLTIDPGVRRDATAYNWRRKRRIYASARLYAATPSRWLMMKVQQSMLAPALAEARVIPNGVDLSTFHPVDRAKARAALDLPPEARVVLFAATSVTRNMWKDYPTVEAAVRLAVEQIAAPDVLLLAVGEAGPERRIGSARVRFVPYRYDPAEVARYFQAADVYLHAARADTFPNSVLEAAACGTPVVATAVGGIPEQIEEGRTGYLVPAGDAPALANRLVLLLRNDELRTRMAHQAAAVARCRFDLEPQADAYLAWYGDLVREHAIGRRGGNA